MPKDSQKTPKSPEVARFMEIKKEHKLTWENFSAEIGVPKRTIQNYVWETGVLSGLALRRTHDRFGVSLDWLLTGNGTMYQGAAPSPTQNTIKEHPSPYANNEGDEEQAKKVLIPILETMDTRTIQDCFYVTALCIEQSLQESGAVPNQDYKLTDLYALAQPFVLEKFKSDGLKIDVFEDGNWQK